MAYITHAQLAERPGSKELAEVATTDYEHLVDYDLMQATLLGEDRGSWTPEEVALADDALERIDDAETDAESVIDGFLGRRGYLPLDPVPGIVTTWCRAITRYFLHKDRLSDDSSDPIVRDYKDAMKLLQLTAEGKFSLGIDDDKTQQGAGEPIFTTGCTVFRDNLRDY